MAGRRRSRRPRPRARGAGRPSARRDARGRCARRLSPLSAAALELFAASVELALRGQSRACAASASGSPGSLRRRSPISWPGLVRLAERGQVSRPGSTARAGRRASVCCESEAQPSSESSRRSIRRAGACRSSAARPGDRIELERATVSARGRWPDGRPEGRPAKRPSSARRDCPGPPPRSPPLPAEARSSGMFCARRMICMPLVELRTRSRGSGEARFVESALPPRSAHGSRGS